MWSLLGGILIPFVYLIITGPLSTLTENYALQNALYAPVGWPKLILYRLFPLGSFPFTNDTSLLVYMIACNVLFYGLLTFCFLTIRARRRAVKSEPPQPPVFSNTN
jgi:hypothetical protein